MAVLHAITHVHCLFCKEAAAKCSNSEMSALASNHSCLCFQARNPLSSLHLEAGTHACIKPSNERALLVVYLRDQLANLALLSKSHMHTLNNQPQVRLPTLPITAIMQFRFNKLEFELTPNKHNM